MIAILINVLAVLVGSAIGALAKRGITEKYITVLNTAMGLAALVLGVNVAMSNMNKSHFPAHGVATRRAHAGGDPPRVEEWK